jgi:hypothetical protein
MSKFSGSTPRRRPVSTVVGSSTTYEGATGVRYDARTELWNLTTAAMVGGEKSFYESADDRDNRVASLTQAIVSEPGGFEWASRFVPFLRREMFMRTAPIMVAAEAARARQMLVRASKAPAVEDSYSVRRLVSSAIGRPDEFGEFVGYWRMRFGRSIPGGVQRGLADAFVDSITEFSALKYDGNSKSYRMGHLIDVIHPEPKAPWQSDLFKYLIDRAQHPSDVRVDMARLPLVAARREAESMSLAARREIAASPGFAAFIKSAGMTWENVSGWLQRELTAQDWEALIPTMGYMALMRNLRNFDDAGVSDSVANEVSARLSDPDQVAKSMQFPYRFYTAYRAAQGTFRWAQALSKALDLSTQNVPVLSGKTLVIVDTSGSMGTQISERSNVQYVDIAALFGCVTASRSENVDVVAFADTAYLVKMPTKANVLRNVDHIRREVGKVGYGTNIGAAQPFLTDHNRVVIFSDMQDIAGLATHREGFHFGYRHGLSIPPETTVFSFNLAGYKAGIVDTSVPNRFVLAGFSDAAFRMMAMVEAHKDQNWPF